MMRQEKRLWVAVPLLACVLWMVTMVLFPFSAMAQVKEASSRVSDDAGLFTSGEIREMEAQIAALREEMNMDVAVVTTDYTGGMSTEEYADEYYEARDYGTGKNHSGVLLLLDMDNRQVYVSTEGAMIRFLEDDRIETMMDHAIPFMQKEDYGGAAVSLLNDVQTYYRKGIPGNQYNYDRETGTVSRHRSIRWYEGLLAAAVAVFCGGSACLSVKKQYAMQEEQRQAANYHMAYRANAQFQFQDQNDALVDQYVAQSLIASAVRGGGRPGGGISGGGGGRSTTHSSSSGRTHGGGGRRF